VYIAKLQFVICDHIMIPGKRLVDEHLHIYSIFWHTLQVQQLGFIMNDFLQQPRVTCYTMTAFYIAYLHVFIEDTAILLRDLASLSKWEKTWQIKFGIPKCYVLHSSRCHQPIVHQYQLEQCTLKTVNEITYLRIAINSKL